MNLQVGLIKISNILGIEDMEIRPGKLTVIKGRNGAGKSSVIESIKGVLKSGHDATLLRNGADKGEAVLVLDDGSRISKSITPTKSTRRFVDASGVPSDAPAGDIAALYDALSANPLEFLELDGKQQVSALLEAMPMRADVAKLQEITGAPVAPELARAHALTAIDAVHKAIYDGRTGTNGAIRDKKGTIRQLEAAIPEALAESDAVDETELEAALAAADEARDAEMKRIDDKLALMERAWQARLDELQAEIDKTKATRVDVRGKAEKQRQRTREQCAAEKQPINDRLLLIRSNRDAAAKARATRETIDKMHGELAKLEQEAEAATDSLAKLDAYKADLLAALPIPGLQVKEGALYYGEVLFKRLNTAEQMKVAVEIAKLRAGPLGLVCVDGAERLNDAAFAEFSKQMIASDVQAIVTRACDGPLKVEALS